MNHSSQSNPFINVEPLRVPIVEAYSEELQPVHQAKNNQAKIQQLHQKRGNLPKMKIEEIKVDAPEAQSHVIPEVYKTPKSDIRVGKSSTHKYNTRLSTKRINHVTTFKNATKMFKMEETEKIKHT